MKQFALVRVECYDGHEVFQFEFNGGLLDFLVLLEIEKVSYAVAWGQESKNERE